RLETVALLTRQKRSLENLIQLLKPIGVLGRLLSKVGAPRSNPRRMQHLTKAPRQIDPICEQLQKMLNWEEKGAEKEEQLTTEKAALNRFIDQLNPCESLLNRIEKELKDEVPIVSNQGNLIKSGVDPELDELHTIAY